MAVGRVHKVDERTGPPTGQYLVCSTCTAAGVLRLRVVSAEAYNLHPSRHSTVSAARALPFRSSVPEFWCVENLFDNLSEHFFDSNSGFGRCLDK